MKTSALISLMRPGHWTKNLFVAAPALFAGELLMVDVFMRVMAATVAFCLVSSAVYCINDSADAESDRRHPVKKFRPVANGSVSCRQAVILAVVLTVVGAVVSWLTAGVWLVAVTMLYLCLNLIYTLRLKQYPVIDITIIAIGFLLRLLAGSLAAPCPLSAWIVIVTFLLALFLGLGKRREDVYIYEETGVKVRRSIAGYSLRFVDMAMALVGAATITAYFIYTVIPGEGRIVTSPFFYLTGIPVTIGLLRYMQICIDTSQGSDHHILMWKDRIILWSLIIYFIIFIALQCWH